MVIDTEKLRKAIGDYYRAECKKIDETIEDDKEAMAEFAEIEQMEREKESYILMVENLAKEHPPILGEVRG